MKKCICNLILVAVVIMIATPQVAKADELAELKAQMKAMQKRLEQLEAKQAKPVAVDQRYVDSLVGNAIEKNKGSIGALPSWVNNITPYGDFRYRHESMSRTNDDVITNDRRRNRIRARLGIKVKISDELSTDFRIASGSSDGPTSTNQTLGDSDSDSFSSKELWLDLAYADWHPATMPGLNIYAGKMKNPFYKVGKNQLIWDGDVNPEGGAFKYGWDLNNSTAATVTGGAFWLRERSSDSGENADAGYFGIQGMLKHILDDGSHLIGGISYYDIGNIDKQSVSGVELEGNTAVSSGSSLYKYDYDMLEFFGEYGFHYEEMPMSVHANIVENTAAPSGSNKGYMIGAKLNKAKAVGSWQLSANYRELESDAVFAGLSDSDFIDGGTGGKGWQLGYKYQMAKNVQAGLTYFINDRDRRDGEGSGGSGSQNFDRLMADLIFKF